MSNADSVIRPEREADLARRVEMMRDEIEELRSSVGNSRKRWYTQPQVVIPMLVSVLALVLSFGTTVLSEHRISRDHDYATRTELRGLIERLTALPVQLGEANRKYRNDPATLQGVSSLLNTEYGVLARQADDLLSQIPDLASGEEYYAVAAALTGSGATAESERILREGLSRADDAMGETALLRQYGATLFAAGDVRQGRQQFERALRIFTKYPEANRGIVAFTHANTELLWAQAELSQRRCAQVGEHLLRADQWAADQGAAPITAAIQGTMKMYSQRCVEDRSGASG